MPKQIDLLISGCLAVTVDKNFSVIENAGIAIDDGKIVDIEKNEDVIKAYRARKTVSAKNKIAIPGLINAHTHAAMVYFRGLADDLPLKEWLENHIWPAESRYVNAEFIRNAVKLAAIEMLKSGTTTFCDMYFLPNVAAEVLEDVKIKAILGVPLLDFPTPVSKSPEEGLKNAQKLIESLKGSSRLMAAVMPHSPYTCSSGLLKQAAEMSKEYDVPLQIHLAEEKWENEKIISEKGMTSVAYLNDLTVLSEKTSAAHVNWISREDMEILKEAKTGVIHNPQSNMKLATGICPVPDLLKMGITVGLGTDGAASNNDLDMFGEIQTAARLHKIARKDPTVISAKQALWMATMGGAKSFGLDKEIGSLEINKKADIVLLDTNKPHLVPLYDAHSQLAYSAKGSDVDTVIIDGKIIVENCNLLTCNEEKILNKARLFSKKLKGITF
ncbi:amidohydrolase [Candidatus Oleimmundimicrobium sp.]|uniref:amidohydrolase family protein n=1 Tax=Candidatus Oleimmundimicrobium sp. TaxID=3060597 RepID=UPI0027279582|nr:amidohydrolase [Candidatus Oleimmundimicrobium sp.]MDO8885377.1 amidohydrolase [Candidatus Oleimmundimicrobium sp.]